MRPGTLLISSIVVLALAVAFVFVARGAGAADPAGRFFWNEDAERYVRRKVASSYVDRLNSEQQREAFYRAMNAYVDLDPYSEFIPPSKHKEWREDIEGKYAGLGVKIESVPEGLLLVGVFPGGPADKAGLQVGDTLTFANKRALKDLEISDVAKILKGLPGTIVHLRVIKGPRPESGPHTGPAVPFQVRRGVISRPTVFPSRVGPSAEYGLIRITEFAEETVDDFDRAVDEMLAAKVKGLILDLRSNGGGVLSAALTMVDRFFAKPVVVLRMEGRGRHTTKQHRAKAEADDVPDLSLVVLVNNGSASASEVVAGALQDHRRALLVGERTYGKFLVQQISEIPGTKAALKLTTSRYYTPSGRSYQADPRSRRGRARPGDPAPEPAGLFPDVIEEFDDKEQELLYKRWADEEGKDWNQAPRFLDETKDFVDRQLQRAIDSLSGDLALRSIDRGKPRNG